MPISIKEMMVLIMAKYFIWLFLTVAPTAVWGKINIPALPGHKKVDAKPNEQRPTTLEDRRPLTPAVGLTTEECNKGAYAGNDVSWDFLRQISGGRIYYDNNVSINDNGELKGHFYLNKYISACFKPSIITVKRGNNIFVRVENTYFDEKREYDSFNRIDDKYENCLQKKGLLTKDGSTIDIQKIESEGLISSVRLSYKNAEKNNAPLILDKNRTYQIYFSSNSTSDYKNNPAKNVRDRPSSQDWTCSTFHQLSSEKGPFHKGKLDLLAQDILDICQGGNLADKIKGVLRLRKSSSLGNFEELSSVVDEILIHALEKEQENIFEGENNLLDIESKMRELLVASRKKDKRIVDTDLSDEAKKLGRKYKKILQKLEDKIYKPTQEMIEKLHKDYENSKSPEERESIDRRLSGLSQIMSKLSERRKNVSCKRGPCAFFRQFYVYEGQEQFRQDASKFEKLRLSSAFWSRSSKDGRGSLSPSSAKRKVQVGMRKFGRRVNAWGKDASVFEGDSSPIRTQQNRLKSIHKRAQKRYQEGPYKGLSLWCRGANTKSCYKQRQRREKTFRRQMRGYGQSLQKNQSLLMHYQELSGQYQLRREYEMEQDGLSKDDYYYGESDYYPGEYSFPGFSNPGQQYRGPYDPSGYQLSPGSFPPPRPNW